MDYQSVILKIAFIIAIVIPIVVVIFRPKLNWAFLSTLLITFAAVGFIVITKAFSE